MKSLVKKLIAPVVLATALLFSPVKANANPSSEKINSLEYAQEVVQMGEYQRWRFGDVWYSNVPLKEHSEDKIKSLSKTSRVEDFTINPFAQPNDTTLNYYGSGDLDSNNVLEQNDLYLMSSKTGPTDQADIDGDGTSFTSEDYNLLFEHINNGTLLPQNNWANPNLKTEQRKDWLEKMLAIDKTDTITYVPGYFECGDFSFQTIINFHGFSELKDSTTASKFSEYNLDNFGRFNLPVYQVSIRGHPSHFINGVLLGDDPLNFNDYYFIEPQNDAHVNPGYWSMPENSGVKVNYSYFWDDGGISTYPFVKFKLNNEVPSLDGNPSQYLLLQRPQVKINPNLENIAKNFKLNQNYPNPFNSQTEIKYSIPLEDKVKLQVYDIQGKLVKTLVNEKQGAGEYTIPLDASNLSSGIYLYRIQTSKGSQTKKMSVLK